MNWVWPIAVSLAVSGAGCSGNGGSSGPVAEGGVESAYIPCGEPPAFPSLGGTQVAIRRDAGAADRPRGGRIAEGVYTLRDAYRIGSGAVTGDLATADSLALRIELSPAVGNRIPVRLSQRTGHNESHIGGELAIGDFGSATFVATCGPSSVLSPGLLAIDLAYTVGLDGELKIYAFGLDQNNYTVLVLHT